MNVLVNKSGDWSKGFSLIEMVALTKKSSYEKKTQLVSVKTLEK